MTAALAIYSPEPLFFVALKDHLALPSLHAATLAQLQEHSARADIRALLLIPQNTAEIPALQAYAFGKPALLLLPLGESADAFPGSTLIRPCTLAALLQAVQQLLAAAAPLEWPGIGGFDPVTLTLSGPDSSCHLTEREAALLTYLAGRAQETPKETLLREVWQYHPEIDSHTLETTLYRLRAKLAESCGERVQICNNDRGYVLKITA